MPHPHAAEPTGALGLILFSGERGRLNYALALAAAAAAIGRSVTILVAGEALQKMLPGRLEDADATAASAPEMLAACVDLGVAFIACEAALREHGLAVEALRGDVDWRVAGLVSVLDAAGVAGNLVFV